MTIRDLTNNPWFISGLSAIALFYLVFSVVMPILKKDDALLAGSSEPVPPADLFGSDINTPVAPLQEVRARHAIGERTNIQWLDDVERDPFQKMLTKPLARSTEPRARREKRLPKLTALFVSRNMEAAVLNDQLVHVGDRVSGFTVTNIEARRVQLERNQKTYWLEPGDD